jgi:hypothetical protein
MSRELLAFARVARRVLAGDRCFLASLSSAILAGPGVTDIGGHGPS